MHSAVKVWNSHINRIYRSIQRARTAVLRTAVGSAARLGKGVTVVCVQQFRNRRSSIQIIHGDNITVCCFTISSPKMKNVGCGEVKWIAHWNADGIGIRLGSVISTTCIVEPVPKSREGRLQFLDMSNKSNRETCHIYPMWVHETLYQKQMHPKRH